MNCEYYDIHKEGGEIIAQCPRMRSDASVPDT